VANDAAKGHDEADKERPAAVVLAVDAPGTSASRVLVLPITHAAPTSGTEAIEIPAPVCRSAGLDATRSWVVLSQFNEFVWPGFDLGFLPGRTPSTIAYGYLTAGFFSRIRKRWMTLDDAGKSRGVLRDV
jgi:hypothetical protein